MYYNITNTGAIVKAYDRSDRNVSIHYVKSTKQGYYYSNMNTLNDYINLLEAIYAMDYSHNDYTNHIFADNLLMPGISKYGSLRSFHQFTSVCKEYLI